MPHTQFQVEQLSSAMLRFTAFSVSLPAQWNGRVPSDASQTQAGAKYTGRRQRRQQASRTATFGPFQGASKHDLSMFALVMASEDSSVFPHRSWHCKWEPRMPDGIPTLNGHSEPKSPDTLSTLATNHPHRLVHVNAIWNMNADNLADKKDRSSSNINGLV